MDRLQVDVEARGLIIQAYLTDEGLVVDVHTKAYQNGNDEEEESVVIATGYEFFSEVGLEPPQPIKEFKELKPD